MTEIPNIPLLLLQCSCFSITLVLALVLLFARYHQHTESRAYESSRWMLIGALGLYVMHYLLQMLFGFRARGEDVGALINILFYTPVAFLFACATLRISAGHRYLRRFVMVGIAGVVVILGLFIAGLCIFRSLKMPWVLSAMEVIYVVLILFFIFNPGGELRRMNRKIEDETADDNSKYNIYMHSSTVLLYAMGAAGALAIFHTRTVFMVAAFFLLALMFYIVSFLSLGFNIQGVSSLVDENEDAHETMDCLSATDFKPEETADTPEEAAAGQSSALRESTAPASASVSRLSAAQVEQVETALAVWRAERGYSTANLTSITMAQRLGIPKRLLTQYLAEHEGSTFRVWLSNIRIEESKRMLLTLSDYSIEAIAEACGFSSRSWMQEKFKASTGMTPAEWREAQKS